MNTNYSEQIFQSIDTIIAQRLNEVSFDRTEICEIISQDKEVANKYLVSNGSLKYEAYVDDPNKKYSNKSKVYVRIANGDYTLRKVITGSYVEDQAISDIYINPFDKLVSNNIYSFEGKQLTIETTKDIKSDIVLDEAETVMEVSLNVGGNKTFDYLGLEFSLNTHNLFKTFSGTYCIEVQLLDDNAETLHPNERIILFSNELYGNPYSLMPVFKFQHLFPFPSIDDITKITQVQVLFGELGGFEKSTIISLQDIKVHFGYDIDKFAAAGVQLMLQEGESIRYSTINANIDDTLRNLYINWNYIDNNGNPHIFHNEQLPDIFYSYKVYWLHYVEGFGNGTTETNENGEPIPIFPDDIAWNWQVINSASDSDFNKTIQLMTKYRTDQYKVIIRYKITEEDENYSFASSNGIVFENIDATADPGATNNSQDSLKLTLGEGDTGVYNIYGLDGRITNTALRGPHTISFSFLDAMTMDDDVKEVKWEFPSSNTMIIASEDEQNATTQSTTFSINTIYVPGAMNNRIFCTVTLNNGEIRRGSLTLQFGESSVNGSTYSLNIDFIGHQNCICIDDGTNKNSIRVKPSFTNANGEDLLDTVAIQWSWVNDEAACPGNNPWFAEIQTNPDTQIATIKYQSNIIPENICPILQAKIANYGLANGVQSDLIAYLPIPIALPNYSYISGPTRVVYAMDNKSFTKSSDNYKLYFYNENDELQEESGVSWEIKPYLKDGEALVADGIPTLRTTSLKDEDGNITDTLYSLCPQGYMGNTMPMVNIVAKKDSNILWSQPILIISNRWESDAANEWDGTLFIDSDTKNGSIKAPFFVAGKKDTNNTLTGVVIGDLTKADVSQGTGIYGFEQGKPRYLLTDNGGFYVGNGNTNFISFNEKVNNRSGSNELLIQTNKFNLKANDNWFVSSNGVSKNKIIGTGTTNYYIYTGGKFGVATDGTFYATDGMFSGSIYADGGNIGGWKIESTRIEIGSWVPDEWKQDNSKYLSFFAAQPTYAYSDAWGTSKYWLLYLRGGKFGVTSDGSLHAKDSVISGELTMQTTTGRVFLEGNHLQMYSGTDDYETLEVWKSAEGDSIISGINGIKITRSNGDNTNLAKFNLDDAFIRSQTITLKYYDGQSAYDHLIVNSSGGDLYGTWNFRGSPSFYFGPDFYDANKNACGWISANLTNSGKPVYNKIQITANSGCTGFISGTWSASNDLSDGRIKNSIEELSEQYELLFDSLKPCRYKYNNGTSGRYHTGYIAQDIVEAIENKTELTTQDFAGIMLYPNFDYDYVNSESIWALRRDEFVALNTWQIQKLKTRVTELEQEIKEIKQRYEI